MSYPGFCAKYGSETMLSCAVVFGVATSVGVDVVQAYSAAQYNLGQAAGWGL
mgnify:CR=1 FL=1|tara:strand:+ start:217414 stop:217569 length:156 start_codon:yes stop_codon:yes gene_type:complete